MPFCYAPWTNLDIDPQGNLAPCCKYRHESRPMNIQDVTIKQYRTGAEISKIKKDFQEDQWPVGCERCRIEEENSIASKRQLDYDRWSVYYDAYDVDQQTDLLTASVAFGNTCNLTCVTCNPWASSRWQKEFSDRYGKDVPPNHFYKQGFVEDLISATPRLIHLDIPGGEPMLAGINQQHELLSRYRSNQHAENIGLHYTTNATLWPNDRWWHLWQHFREIDLQISLDGIGNRLSYIRYPAVWNQVVDNVVRYVDREKTMPNLRLSVSCTVSAYNIGYLDELITWCYNIGLPKPWLGRVHNPAHMRPTVWPAVAKDYVIGKLKSSDHQDLHVWADMLQRVDDSNLFGQFRSHVQQQDRYRGTKFREVFPEMSNFL